ncbi:MAG TPA: hypothetical protein VGR89_07315 [Puia sp.]|nr:hypothetical protein [Puia sp.]
MPSSDKNSYFDTDKIEPHGYFQSYMKLAAEIGPRGKVIELGVQNGESLRIWQSLFPLGDITGIDLDKNATWPEGTKKIVSEQNDIGLLAELDENQTYDLIVDDASHDGGITQQSWMILWQKLKPGGYYVIEDWQVALRFDDHWGACYGPSMLKTAETFLTMLTERNGQIEEITYRYGLIIIKKNPEYVPGNA